MLEEIRAIDAYILCELFCYVLLYDSLPIFVYMYAQVLTFSRSSELYFTTFLG